MLLGRRGHDGTMAHAGLAGKDRFCLAKCARARRV